jgi:hypothetical protein
MRLVSRYAEAMADAKTKGRWPCDVKPQKTSFHIKIHHPHM